MGKSLQVTQQAPKNIKLVPSRVGISGVDFETYNVNPQVTVYALFVEDNGDYTITMSNIGVQGPQGMPSVTNEALETLIEAVRNLRLQNEALLVRIEKLEELVQP
jgi:hypothetical protein